MEDNFFKLASVKVGAQSSNDGKDCYWNIAKSQLEEAGKTATSAEIAELAQKIQELNQEKNASIKERGGMPSGNDEVFIPLEYAIEEIKTNVDKKTQAVNSAIKSNNTAQTNLSAANNAVTEALSKLQSAMTAYDSAQSECNRYKDPQGSSAQEARAAFETAKTALDEAKAKYEEAINKQASAKTQANKTEIELGIANDGLRACRQELEEIQKEYQEEKDEYEQELKEVASKLTEIDTKIETATTALNNVKNEAEQRAAQASLDAAVGITEKGQDGKLKVKDYLNTSWVDKAAENTRGVKNAEVLPTSRGGHRMLISYTDGSKEEYDEQIDDKGIKSYSKEPIVKYDKDGIIIVEKKADKAQDGDKKPIILENKEEIEKAATRRVAEKESLNDFMSAVNNIAGGNIALNYLPTDIAYYGVEAFDLNNKTLEETMAELPKKSDGSYDTDAIKEAYQFAMDKIKERNQRAVEKFDDHGVYQRQLENISAITLALGPEVNAIFENCGVDTSTGIGIEGLMNILGYLAEQIPDDTCRAAVKKIAAITKSDIQIKEDVQNTNKYLDYLDSLDLNNPDELEQFLTDYKKITGTSFSVDNINDYKDAANKLSYETGKDTEKEVLACGYNAHYSDAIMTDMVSDIAYNVILKTVVPQALKKAGPIPAIVGTFMPAYIELIDTVTQGEDNSFSFDKLTFKKVGRIALVDLVGRNLLPTANTKLKDVADMIPTKGNGFLDFMVGALKVTTNVTTGGITKASAFLQDKTMDFCGWVCDQFGW